MGVVGGGDDLDAVADDYDEVAAQICGCRYPDTDGSSQLIRSICPQWMALKPLEALLGYWVPEMGRQTAWPRWDLWIPPIQDRLKQFPETLNSL